MFRSDYISSATSRYLCHHNYSPPTLLNSSPASNRPPKPSSFSLTPLASFLTIPVSLPLHIAWPIVRHQVLQVNANRTTRLSQKIHRPSTSVQCIFDRPLIINQPKMNIPAQRRTHEGLPHQPARRLSRQHQSFDSLYPFSQLLPAH